MRPTCPSHLNLLVVMMAARDAIPLTDLTCVYCGAEAALQQAPKLPPHGDYHVKGKKNLHDTMLLEGTQEGLHMQMLTTPARLWSGAVDMLATAWHLF